MSIELSKYSEEQQRIILGIFFANEEWRNETSIENEKPKKKPVKNLFMKKEFRRVFSFDNTLFNAIEQWQLQKSPSIYQLTNKKHEPNCDKDRSYEPNNRDTTDKILQLLDVVIEAIDENSFTEAQKMEISLKVSKLNSVLI